MTTAQESPAWGEDHGLAPPASCWTGLRFRSRRRSNNSASSSNSSEKRGPALPSVICQKGLDGQQESPRSTCASFVGSSCQAFSDPCSGSHLSLHQPSQTLPPSLLHLTSDPASNTSCDTCPSSSPITGGLHQGKQPHSPKQVHTIAATNSTSDEQLPPSPPAKAAPAWGLLQNNPASTFLRADNAPCPTHGATSPPHVPPRSSISFSSTCAARDSMSHHQDHDQQAQPRSGIDALIAGRLSEPPGDTHDKNTGVPSDGSQPSCSSPLLLLAAPALAAPPPTPEGQGRLSTRSSGRSDLVISQAETADKWTDSLLLRMIINNSMVVGGPGSSEAPSLEHCLGPTYTAPASPMTLPTALSPENSEPHPPLQHAPQALCWSPTTGAGPAADAAAAARAAGAGGSGGGGGSGQAGSQDGAAGNQGGSKMLRHLVVAGVALHMSEEEEVAAGEVGGAGAGARGRAGVSQLQAWMRGAVAGGGAGVETASWPVFKSEGSGGQAGSTSGGGGSGDGASSSAPLPQQLGQQQRFKGFAPRLSGSLHNTIILGSSQDLMSIAEDEEEAEEVSLEGLAM